MDDSNVRLKQLLDKCSEEQLKPLYDLLEDKITGRSTNTQELSDELRLWGSNTIASIFRGWNGVDYIKVVEKVGKRLKAKLPNDRDERKFEVSILMKLIEQYVEKADEEDRKDIEDLLKKCRKDFRTSIKPGFGKAVSVGLLGAFGEEAMKQVMKRVISRILAGQAAKQGIKFAGRFAGMAVPLLNIALGAWILIDIAGPAYRKTVPAVIQVALLRLEVDV